jgi:ferredoxin-NADP reductase
MSDVLKAKMQTATLVHREVLGNGRLGIFRLMPDSGKRWWYQAGQYTTLGLDTPGHGFVPRAYSIAGSPLDEGLEFYIALVDNGQLTPTIFAQNLGAKFRFLSPKGKFTLRQAGKRTVVMVATGTGLAPFIGHIRTLWKTFEAGVPVDHRIILFHGASFADEFAYRAELEKYAAAHKVGFDFHYVTTASRPDPARGWTPTMGSGRVNELVRYVFNQPITPGRTVALPQGMDKTHLQGLVDPARTAFMACGNPGMIEDLREPVKHIGVETYLVEEFWKASTATA